MDHPRYDHMLTAIDARIKLVTGVSVLAMVLSCEGFAFPALITLMCLFLCVAMGVPARTIALRFSEPLFLAAVVIVVKFFFSGHDALVTLHVFGAELTGYQDGLHEGLRIGIRILGAVSVVALVGFATPFTEFLAALSWFRLSKGFVEILMLAYRYIFVLLEDAQVIYQAQKNRLGYATVGRRLSSFGTLAGSLTIRAFDHSRNTAVAMAQRGYDGTMPAHVHKPFRTKEIAASVVVIAMLGVLWNRA